MVGTYFIGVDGNPTPLVFNVQEKKDFGGLVVYTGSLVLGYKIFLLLRKKKTFKYFCICCECLDNITNQ